MTENKKLEEISNAEVAEETSLKYEEKLAQTKVLAKTNYNLYQKEKQSNIDLREENERLKEKLEQRTLENLRSQDLARKSKSEQENLLLANAIFDEK